MTNQKMVNPIACSTFNALNFSVSDLFYNDDSRLVFGAFDFKSLNVSFILSHEHPSSVTRKNMPIGASKIAVAANSRTLQHMSSWLDTIKTKLHT